MVQKRPTSPIDPVLYHTDYPGRDPNTYHLQDVSAPYFTVIADLAHAWGDKIVDLQIRCKLLDPRSVREDGIAFVSRIDQATFRLEGGLWSDKLDRIGLQLNRFPEEVSLLLDACTQYSTRPIHKHNPRE
jgi:hypothetical protein